MVFDLLEHDLSVLCKQQMGRSAMHCHIEWDVQDASQPYSIVHSVKNVERKSLNQCGSRVNSSLANGLIAPLHSLIPSVVV